jgi:hypothetical protein
MTRARLSFIGKQVPGGFQVSVIVIPPRGERQYDAAEWQAALVVVERGCVDLVGDRDHHLLLTPGAALALTRIHLRAIANRGATAAVLSVVSRTERHVRTVMRGQPVPPSGSGRLKPSSSADFAERYGAQADWIQTRRHSVRGPGASAKMDPGLAQDNELAGRTLMRGGA